ncbi:hypothetical protein MBAV_003701, partial [Candidatus Magnetobacterium bavaricum]
IKDGNYLDKARGISSDWQTVVIGDIDGDGMSDIVLQNSTTGDVIAWFMRGFNITGSAVLANDIPREWQIK